MTLSLGLGMNGRSVAAAGASGLSRTFIDAGTAAVISSGTIDLDFTGIATNDQIYLLVGKIIGAQTHAVTAVTLEGSSATLVGGTSPTASRCKAYIYKIACPAAAANNATATVGVTLGGGDWIVGAYKLSASPSTETVTANQYTSTTSPLVGSVNTVSGGVLLGIAVQENTTSLTWTGATEDSEATVDAGSDRVEWVSASTDSTETPRTVQATHAGTAHAAIITVALS